MSEFRVKYAIKKPTFPLFSLSPVGRPVCPDLGSTITKTSGWHCGPAVRFQEAIWSSTIHNGEMGNTALLVSGGTFYMHHQRSLGRAGTACQKEGFSFVAVEQEGCAKLSLITVRTSYILVVAVLTETPPPGCTWWKWKFKDALQSQTKQKNNEKQKLVVWRNQQSENTR